MFENAGNCTGDSPPPVPCRCLSADANVASASKLEKTRTLIDKSHFSIDVRRCVLCRQIFLAVFTELIDWDGGDDSQALALIPLTATETTALVPFNSVADAERALSAMRFRGPQLWWVRQRGSEATAYWSTRDFMLLPHD